MNRKRGDHREREDRSASIWSTTRIFIALGLLTALMGLLMYGALQGMSSSAPMSSRGELTPEIRANR